MASESLFGRKNGRTYLKSTGINPPRNSDKTKDGGTGKTDFRYFTELFGKHKAAEFGGNAAYDV
jgi:hypothetical protein